MREELVELVAHVFQHGGLLGTEALVVVVQVAVCRLNDGQEVLGNSEAAFGQVVNHFTFLRMLWWQGREGWHDFIVHAQLEVLVHVLCLATQATDGVKVISNNGLNSRIVDFKHFFQGISGGTAKFLGVAATQEVDGT